MKGRYAGSHMTVYGSLLPGAASIARWAYQVNALTPAARYRIKVLDWHRTHGANVSLTARRFGLDRGTVRRWQRRFAARGVLGLNDQSHRPQHLRQPTTHPDIVVRIVRFRKQYPAWSKHKIAVLLRGEGVSVSASTIGRILKRRGLIDPKAARKRRRAALRPKRRFPKGLKINAPGQLIQIDTKEERAIDGTVHYQFTAIDVLTKRRVLQAHASASSRNGARFLRHCIEEYPYPIQDVQTDNGSPFLGEFEGLCTELGITHYFIHPRSPKENTYVERSHGADEKEFYDQGNLCVDRVLLQTRLKEWQRIWNEVRPHQALNYLTPKQYEEKWQYGRLPTRDTIVLQA